MQHAKYNAYIFATPISISISQEETRNDGRIRRSGNVSAEHISFDKMFMFGYKHLYFQSEYFSLLRSETGNLVAYVCAHLDQPVYGSQTHGR